MSGKEYVLQQTVTTITYDWQEYNLAIYELNKLQSDKERVTKAVDYLKSHDLSDDRYLFLFETARKISDLIDTTKIDTTPVFKRRVFVANAYNVVEKYFGLYYKNLKISHDWDPLNSHCGEYRTGSKDKTKSKIWMNEPLFFAKHDMIWCVGVYFHEFWHHLQTRFPDEIGYHFSDEKLKFNKYKLRGKNKWILYRYNPFEQEGWFAGYALMYFLHKKTEFKHGMKKLKQLESKSDKDVIEVLKNMGRV